MANLCNDDYDYWSDKLYDESDETSRSSKQSVIQTSGSSDEDENV